MKSRINQHRLAFTLIELLVVIAIIAILAAILFPVFAQAREKARQASCMSNLKQGALAVMQYTQDYDETFPVGHMQLNWVNQSWVISVQPYMKNLAVFFCPSDPIAGDVAPDASGWAGRNVSYAANGFYSGNWCCNPTWTQGFPLRGPMGIAFEGWLDSGNGASTLSDMTRPADTILIAEKYSGESTYWARNSSGFSPNTVFGGDVTHNIGWGDMRTPNGTRTPAKYPNGINGAVSTHKNGMANFAFVDGHVKAMKPERTNPDPATRPLENMWDGKRP